MAQFDYHKATLSASVDSFAIGKSVCISVFKSHAGAGISVVSIQHIKRIFFHKYSKQVIKINLI